MMSFKTLITVISILLLLYLSNGSNIVNENNDDMNIVANDEPFGLETIVNVILIGFNGSGGFNYKLDDISFNKLLDESYPIHRPHSIEKSKYLHHLDKYYDQEHNLDQTSTSDNTEFKSLLIHNDIQYRVKHLSDYYLSLLESTMTKNLKENYKLSIEPLEAFFEQKLPLNGVDLSEFTIIFLNPNKDRVLQQQQQQKEYEYTFNNRVCGSAWISSGRFIVVDLAAKGLSYGSTIHKSNEELISEGSVTLDSLPRLIEYFLKDGQVGTSFKGESPIELQAHMSAVVIQSLQHLFLFDSRYDYIPIFKKILIPILIFKDHHAGSNSNSTFVQDHSLTLDIIKREATRLFPFSEVSLVVGEHSLHDHKHISMALSKSIQYHTSFELDPKTNTFKPFTKNYIDSRELLSNLKNEDDMLASGLIGDNVTPVPEALSKSSKSNHNGETLTRTKILPVYIFSLESQKDLFIDKYQIYASNQEAVVVVQSHITTKDYSNIYYYDNSTVDIDTSVLDRYIVAGLASSQGVMGPFQRFSQEHFRLVNNYLWSFGQHPFGYFGNSSGISQIFIDGIIRNTIITSIQAADHSMNIAYRKLEDFSETYLMNSFGFDIDEIPPGLFLIDRLYHRPPSKLPILKKIIARFHDELDEINKIFQSTLRRSYKTVKRSEIIRDLLVISVKASGFLESVDNELKKVESELLCCAIKSSPTPMIADTTSNFRIFYITMIIFFIVLFICCCICRV